MFFKNHFGMVVSTVIAIILSLCMATAAIFVDQLTFTVPLWIKNWGTAFLTIMLCSIVFPTKLWGDKMALACKRKPNTLSFGLLANIIPTLIYNTFATLVLAAVNIFCNEHIPAQAQLGAYLASVGRDLPIMFVISYVLALISEKIALKVAFHNVPPAMELQQNVDN